MGSQNHPDTAIRAGEEVLPQSDTESEGGAMGLKPVETSNDAPSQAFDPSKPATAREPPETVGDRNVLNMKPAAVIRPELPRLVTQESKSPKSASTRDAASQTHWDERSQGNARSQRSSWVSQDELPGLGIDGVITGRTPSSSRSPLLGVSPGSPNSYRLAVPSRTPTNGEVLPALQPSPGSESSRSPGQQQGLPSLHDSGLKPLLDGRPPRNGYRAQVAPTGLTAVLSPPMSSKTANFPSPPSRSGNNFASQFSHGHPSPAYSNASPRDSNNMSPPSRPGVQLPPFRNRVASGSLTPQSIDGCSNNRPSSLSPKPGTEMMQIDRPGRVLPPLTAQPGPPIITGHFECKHQGCTAAPFQTQYLLNSHAKVHSHNRPHYCPVPNCSRAEGGKGFKRKNEMIRHGLVHRSPGYVCPFCPEREHKYPRPDNLQRHVRVNHMDKDLNDPRLRQVLSLRLDGGNRGRRRRLAS